jgi:hypothetical protein
MRHLGSRGYQIVPQIKPPSRCKGLQCARINIAYQNERRNSNCRTSARRPGFDHNRWRSGSSTRIEHLYPKISTLDRRCVSNSGSYAQVPKHTTRCEIVALSLHPAKGRAPYVLSPRKRLQCNGAQDVRLSCLTSNASPHSSLRRSLTGHVMTSDKSDRERQCRPGRTRSLLRVSLVHRIVGVPSFIGASCST